MTLAIADRVMETTTTTGIGTYTLAGAKAGFQAFSVVGDANTTFYTATDGVSWETGIGTYTLSGTTLARTSVIASSNAGAAVNWGAGSKDIFVDGPANFGSPFIVTSTTNRCIQIADQTALTSIAGNARGFAAIDLQTLRTYATAIASGDYAIISGGLQNTASGTCAVVSGGNKNSAVAFSTVSGGRGNLASGYTSVVGGGRYNTANNSWAVVGGGSYNVASNYGALIAGGYRNVSSATYSVVGGGQNNTANAPLSTISGGARQTASGDNSTIGGGYLNTASGHFSTVSGGSQAVASHYGQMAHSSGQFAAQGDAQKSEYILRNKTTDATPTELFLDGTAAQLVLANNTTWTWVVRIVAWRTDSKAAGNSGSWIYAGGIVRVANAASTALIGSNASVLVNPQSTGWSIAITADTTNGSLKITVTGTAGQTIQWVCDVITVETTG